MQNTLLQSAKKAKFSIPIIGILALGFMMFNLGLTASGYVEQFLTSKFSYLLTKQEYLSLFVEGGLVAILVFLWTLLVERRSITSLGFFRKHAIKNLTGGLLLGAGFFSLIIGIITLLGYDISFSISNLSQGNIVAVAIMLLFWMIQATGEEVLIRGWALPSIVSKSDYSFLPKGTKLWVGVALSSLLFVAIHYGNTGSDVLAYTNLFIFGVVFALLALRYQNLWIAIGFHAAWNFVQSCIFGMSVSGNPPSTIRLFTTLLQEQNSLISGGKFGIEGSVITTIVGIVLCSYFIWSLWKIEN